MAKQQSIPNLIAKAQNVFNAWIRERDKHLRCISCNTGAVEQAGHYLSAGHHSAFRFSEINVNGQCVRCNMHLHGNLIKYRMGLVKKYGANIVEMLEGNSLRRAIHKWDRTDLEIIITKYKINAKKKAN